MSILKKDKGQEIGGGRFTCPECSSRSMIKIENKETGFYTLRCEECGAAIGPLPLKSMKDLIS